MKNQKQAINAVVTGIANGDADQVREGLEFLTNAKRLSAEGKDALSAATEFLTDEEQEEEAATTMAGQLAKYRVHYVKSTAASGNASMHTGDDIATKLSGLDHTQVCQLADKLLGLHPGTKKNPGEKPHIKQYDRLNNGQKRMNAGNRIRAAFKNGDENVTEWAAK
jgi:hypothetical protein